jgi:hypothetical protein
MSFQPILTNINYGDSQDGLFKKLFAHIDSSLNISNYNFSACSLHFDIEDAHDAICHINKQERDDLNTLYQKDQFEYINTMLWKFLQTNPKTKSKLDLCDQIIVLMTKKSDLSIAEIDAFIKRESNFRSFKSLKKNILDLHHVDFDEYKAFREGTLKQFHEQQYLDVDFTLIPLTYQYPILKKLTHKIFIEIHPYMNKDISHKYIQTARESARSMFMERLYSSHKIKLLYDALVLYKYYIDIKNHYLEEKSNQTITKKIKFKGYEVAKRYYNCHILQKFGFSFAFKKDNQKLESPKSLNNEAKIIVGIIETNEKMLFTNFKFIDRKRVLAEVEKFLKLPSIGILET